MFNPRASSHGSAFPVVATLALSLLLAACGKGGDHGGQVAVKVGRDEVTVLQLNEQIARIPANADASQVDEAKRQALKNLVDRQLLVQQAIDQKLDRDPAVVGAIEASRAAILAQAYVTRVVAPQAKPSEDEIRQYYESKPELFSQRRIFRLQEISAGVTEAQATELRDAASRMRSLKEFATRLRDEKIPFSVDSGVRAAEQIPFAILGKVAVLHSGEIFVYAPAPGRLDAIEVIASELQPVDQAKATPVIEQALTNQKREKLTRDEVARLEGATKIEYVGDFARFAPGAAPAKPAAAEPAAGADAGKERGISGLR